MTVCFGDAPPTHAAGRLLGALVMLEGTAFIAIVTAVITSKFATRSTRDYVAAQGEDELSYEARLDRRFDGLERKLDLLVTARENARA
jgi:hypothetical protein